MHFFSRRFILGSLLAALLAGSAAAQEADYRRSSTNLRAREAYNIQASAYWDAVSDKRRTRNAKRREHQPIALPITCSPQPPAYCGPPRPVNPTGPTPVEPQPEIPVIADFLKAAASEFNFVPTGR